MKRFWLLCLFFSAFFFVPVAALEISEDAPGEEPYVIELGDPQAIEKLKEQLVQREALQNSAIIPEEMDIEHSDLLLEGLDITHCGSQEGIVHFTLKPKTVLESAMISTVINKTIPIEIVDTTAPVIGLKYPHITMDYEEELLPLDWVETVTDNSLDETIEVTADMSTLDSSVAGEQEIVYQATDASGNTGYATLAITVRPKPIAANALVSGDAITTMLNLMNAAREANGLSSLSLGDAAAQSAIGVRACEASESVSHTRPDGRHYKTAFDDFGVSYSSPYEILTYSGTSVQDKFDWWMSSSGHRGYILSGSSTKVAIGSCGKMWAAIIYN